MKIVLLLKSVLREVKNSRWFALLFVFNMTLGLAGFLALDSFKRSLDEQLQASARDFLSADVALDARRQFTDAEVESLRGALPQGSDVTRLWEFFSMANVEKRSLLVQVKAIEEAFPFFGKLILQGGEVHGPDQLARGPLSQKFFSERIIWVSPDFLQRMQLRVGQDLFLGDEKFTIGATVEEDSTQTFRMASLAPRVYAARKWMDGSSLVSRGSTMSEAWLVRLPSGASEVEVAAALKSAMTDQSIDVETYTEAGGERSRALAYLGDYLGIVSLVALFLACLGAAYLFRSFLFSRLRSVAIYHVLGMTRGESQGVYLLQLSLFGALGAVLATLLAWLLLPVLEVFLQSFTPVSLQLHLSLATVGVALAIGVFASVFVCFPFLLPLKRLPVSALFQEQVGFRLQSRWTDFLYYLPSLVALWALSVWQANSVKVGSWFLFGLLAALATLLLVGWLLVQLVRTATASNFWPLRHAGLLLVRRPLATLGAVVSLGLGTMLLNIMPQLKVSLRQEISSPNQSALPSLFAFDIQDEQVQPLRKFLGERQIEIASLSPLVRARILSVNGASFERAELSESFTTREEQTEARFRNRAVNLSFRDRLSDAESLVEGKFWTRSFETSEQSPSESLPELSIEARYAERIGLKLGDRVEFDVQGVTVMGEVTSLRSVRWNSFQPNFFVLVQPGVLEEAPKIWLANINGVAADLVQQLQSEVGQQFGNISLIDVRGLTQKIWELANQMSWALESMAWLSVLVGVLVLFSIASHQARARRKDLNLMKVLGADRNRLLQLVSIEFFVIGSITAFFGAALALGLAWALSRYVFTTAFVMDSVTPMVSAFGVIALSVAVAAMASLRVLRENPAVIFSEGRE